MQPWPAHSPQQNPYYQGHPHHPHPQHHPHPPQAPQAPAGLAGTPITFDVRPWQQVKENVWADASGDAVVLDFFGVPPNLPAPLEDVAALRARTSANTAEAGMGLVELDVIWLDGLPAVRQMVKGQHPQGQGMAYIGTYTVPRATCSVVLKVQCLEGQPTGTREAAVLPGFLQQYQGGTASPEQAMAAWAQHPYAYGLQGGTPRTHADDPAWDAHYPHHPLSRARRILGGIAHSVRLDPGFRALPPFGLQQG